MGTLKWYVANFQAGSCPQQIDVYSPTASGKDKPIQSIPTLAGFLAVDPTSGQLYDSVNRDLVQSTIFVFGNPRTHPKRLRTILELPG